jgi:hypothetical protein
MFETAKALWVRWRESRRQYQIDRAVFKASGGMEQYARQRDGDLSMIAGSTGGADAGGAAGGGGVAGGGLGGT